MFTEVLEIFEAQTTPAGVTGSKCYKLTSILQQTLLVEDKGDMSLAVTTHKIIVTSSAVRVSHVT